MHYCVKSKYSVSSRILNICYHNTCCLTHFLQPEESLHSVITMSYSHAICLEQSRFIIQRAFMLVTTNIFRICTNCSRLLPNLHCGKTLATTTVCWLRWKQKTPYIVCQVYINTASQEQHW